MAVFLQETGEKTVGRYPMPVKSQRFEPRQRMKNNTFEVFRYRDDSPKEVALHHHDFYEIYFFLSGSVQYNVESRS